MLFFCGRGIFYPHTNLKLTVNVELVNRVHRKRANKLSNPETSKVESRFNCEFLNK